MSVKKILRQERKFLINMEDYFRFNHIFAKCFKEDSHNGTNGYVVRSLYFDTNLNKDYQEKLAGIECRRKMRLRIYDTDSPTAFLEMKQKQGTNQLKRSLEISREDAEKIAQGDYKPLLNYQDPFAQECYGVLQTNFYLPKVIVEYQRKAFIIPENDIRITFDSCICATDITRNFFKKELGAFPVLHQSNVVLEVKYNHFLLSYVKKILQINDNSETSVSKYVLARSKAIKY